MVRIVIDTESTAHVKQKGKEYDTFLWQIIDVDDRKNTYNIIESGFASTYDKCLDDALKVVFPF